MHRIQLRGLVITASIVALGLTAGCAGGRRDRAVFVSGDGVEHETRTVAASTGRHRSNGSLRPSVAGLDRPKSLDEFTQFWHQPCISQDSTGQCWAFASNSYLESEIYRQTGRKVRVSQAWTVYWDYVGKARRFIQEQGDSFFANGSEPNSIVHVWREHGIVPFDAYTGLLPGQKRYSDGRMYSEMVAYLDGLKERKEWNLEEGIAAIRKILDQYMGAPPETVEVDGAKLTPQEYRQRFANVDVDQFVSIISLQQEPWYDWCVYDVPDNWWRSREYYNVPLVDFTRLIRAAVRSGHSICLLEDVSEPGFYGRQSVAIVPSFDIPSEYIDDAARQFRFSNSTTQDDHGVHVVGYTQRGGRYWYLVKDSGGGPRRGKFGGYMFYDEDYLRLKVLGIVLPRKIIEETLGRNLGPMPAEKAGEPVVAQAG